MTISLSDLKAKRAAMSRPGPRCSACNEFKLTSDGQNYDPVCVCGYVHAQPTDDMIRQVVADRLRREWRPDLADALVATHNAADVLIAVCEAALAWRDQRADNLLAALARTDAEIEAEAQDVSRARVKRTAELASALERALAKIKP